MASILKITDGTTTVDFLNDAAYRVEAWSPAVATRRASALGGRGPYNDVVEEMELNIRGASVLAKLATLEALMDQAERWSRGENAAAVVLHYQPTAASPELKATILGPESPGATMVELPPNFALSPTVQMIDPVILRFRRLGLWLGAEVSGTSSSAEHPTSLTVALSPAVDIESPVVVKLNGITGPEDRVWNSYILLSSGATTTEAGKRLLVLDAESMAGVAGWGTAADSTNKARGGWVLRLLPTVVNTYYISGSVSLATLTDRSARRWGVYVNYRCNSASASFRLRARLNYTYGNVLHIPAGVTTPQWAFLGAISTPAAPVFFSLSGRASILLESLDIDTVVLQAMDDEATSRAVAIMPKEENETTFGSAYSLRVDHRLLSKPAPGIWYQAGAIDSDVFESFLSDGVLVMRGGAVAAAWLGTGQQLDDYWRVTHANGTVINSDFTVSRLEGHLTPE